MDQQIPGIITHSGREILYLECESHATFASVTDAALAANPQVPLPTNGGALEEKARLIWNNRSLLAVSYKGDIVGWRNKYVAYCKARNRLWGIAVNGQLRLSDGSCIALSSATVELEP